MRPCKKTNMKNTHHNSRRTTSHKIGQLSPLLDTHDVAKYLKCCTKTVQKYAISGQIESSKFGRLRRFTQQAIMDFVAQSSSKGGK